MKKIYVAMCADFFHYGHLNIINNARKYGKVIVGLLTDEAVMSYKRVPAITYENRKIVVESIRGVDMVVPQHTLSYKDNLLSLKPDYVLHAENWKHGVQRETRQEVIDVLSLWGGELIEIPYTDGISSTQLHKNLKSMGITPGTKLKELI